MTSIFYLFLTFIRGWRAFFISFSLSSMDDGQFFPKICNLLSYLSILFWKSSIYCRIWAAFSGNLQFTIVFEQAFLKIFNLLSYLSSFFKKSTIYFRIWMIFRVFCISSADDGLFSSFFARRLQAKLCFSRFLHFAYERRMIFSIFWLFLVRESQFLLISCFPSWGKTDFWWFLIFPRGRKPFFADFWFSPVEESRFSPIFVRRTPTKRDFSYFPLIVGVRSLVLCVFHQSYPYESFIFLFFVDCIPYLNKFSRKLIIYHRIWVIFLENRWLYPLIWTDFLENNRPFLCLKTSFDYRFIFLSWHSFSYKKGKKE